MNKFMLQTLKVTPFNVISVSYPLLPLSVLLLLYQQIKSYSVTRNTIMIKKVSIKKRTNFQ